MQRAKPTIMDPVKTIYEDDKIKISKKEKDSDKTFISFSSLNLVQEEFIKVGDNATVIFIMDKTKSWGNFDWENIYKIVYPYLVNKRVFAIGHSMGGYCAILSSRYFLLEKVIAFSPQYSVHKTIVPKETRWKIRSIDMRKWEHISLKGSFNDKTEYHIFYGDDAKESVHRELFPEQENITMYIYEGDHSLVRDLKGKGLLYGLISEIVNQVP
jgi:hypothetical protein